MLRVQIYGQWQVNNFHSFIIIISYAGLGLIACLFYLNNNSIMSNICQVLCTVPYFKDCGYAQGNNSYWSRSELKTYIIILNLEQVWLVSCRMLKKQAWQ